MLGNPKLPASVAVVALDAGACNLMLPWLDQAVAQGHVLACVQGPSRALWQNRFGTSACVDTLEAAMAGRDLVLTGTGWASTLEHDARVLASDLGIQSVAVIDHWVNYPERFVFHGRQQWPDQFWVSDDCAVTIASRHFPVHRLRCYANHYLREQVQAIKPLRAGQGDGLLVMEPLRHDWGRGVAGEWQALDYFMQRRQAVGLVGSVRLRPHPSDAPGKYAEWLTRHPAVSLDTHDTLAAALGPARWVVGCESFALVVALAAGREVWSSLPPWAPACRLPHAGLRHLSTTVLAPVATWA